jgi:hypothetical protein
MAPRLKAKMTTPSPIRDRTIVVYGRPETPRNGFPAIVDGLRAWYASDPQAGSWRVVSVGRKHEVFAIGPDLVLEPLGMLDLDAYADLLRSSAIGLSLMLSPHPSYPPLDMAHLGMVVLTNTFGDKDLSTWHTNIRSIDDVRAETIAAALTAACEGFLREPALGDRGVPLNPDYLSESPQFPFGAELARELGLTTAGPAKAHV